MGGFKHWLDTGDISCIEHMAGYKLTDCLKDYLLETYGLGSDYQAMGLWKEDAMKGCDGNCEDCYACAYEQDSLLDQVFTIVSCYKRNRFDVEKHSYKDACEELSFRWAWHDDPDLPF